MKRMIPVIFSLMVFTVNAQPTEVQVRPFNDYYYSGTLQLNEGLNCLVLTNRKEFKKLFGDTNRPDTPDFSKEVMLVMVMPATKWDAKLSFQRISMKAGQFIEVYCKVNYGRHKLTYQSYPLRVCAIPRYTGINKVNFYNEKRMQPLASVLID